MAEQTYVSSDQKHYIDPWNQRVFQYNTDQSDVFLSRVANSVFRIFGDDIVLSGLELTGSAYAPDAVSVSLKGGDLLQDTTLLKIPDDDINVELAGLSGLNSQGRIVVMSNYRYLETFEKNDQYFNINYISQGGTPLLGFDQSRDRIVLGILQFTKDPSDNVTSFFVSPDTEIVILGKTYYLRGFSPENKRLTAYILHQLFSVASGFSVILDPTDGIKLRNDVVAPGPGKYYGTGPTGHKGFFDVSELSFDNISNVDEYLGEYNQVLYNGNLFFVKPGHDVASVYGIPPLVWNPVYDDTYWEIDTGGTWDGSKWVADNLLMSLVIKLNSGWQMGFRPNLLRITGNVGGAGTVSMFDTNGQLITSMPAGQGEQTTILDFTNVQDIKGLNLFGYTDVTNIEFEGGVLGAPLPPLVWDPLFSSVFWEVQSGGTWDGSKFVADVDSLIIRVNTAENWQDGFRPTYVRVTGTAVGTGPAILRDDNSNVVSILDPINTGQKVGVLDFSNNLDIGRFELSGYSEVTNIEFVGGTLGLPLAWQSLFDQTFWVPESGGSWSTDRWVSPTNDLILNEVNNGWVIGYRPVKIRITGTSPLGGMAMLFAPNLVASIVHAPGTRSTEFDLPALTDDITLLNLAGYSEITNIEFAGYVLSTPVWYEVLDDTFWEASSGGNWNTDHWLATENDMIIIPAASSAWAANFRPTQVEITGNVFGSTLTLRDTQNNVIATATGVDGTTTMPITFQGYDIGALHFDGYETITDIQFESVQPSPPLGEIPCSCNCNYACTCDCNYAAP